MGVTVTPCGWILTFLKTKTFWTTCLIGCTDPCVTFSQLLQETKPRGLLHQYEIVRARKSVQITVPGLIKGSKRSAIRLRKPRDVETIMKGDYRAPSLGATFKNQNPCSI